MVSGNVVKVRMVWSLLLLLLSCVKFCCGVTDPGDLKILMDFKNGLDNPELLKWPENGDDPCGPPAWPHVFCSNGRVTQIQVQNLGLIGPLPQNFNQLTKLYNIGLQRNQFSGKLPTFKGLSELEFAFLDFNEFDTIPSDFFEGLSSIRVLALDKNPLNKTNGWSIPIELENYTQLTNLSLGGCNLVGPVPDFLGNLASLNVLILSNNRLSGEIPVTFGQSLMSILWLNDQEGGGLTGSIDVIANMSSLRQAWLHGNSFTSTIPENIGELSLLKDLNLNGNQLVGMVPQSLADMELDNLDLSNNQLMGPIPEFKAGKFSYESNLFCQSKPGVQCAPEVNELLGFLDGVNYPTVIASQWSGNDPCGGQWLGLNCVKSKVSVISLPRHNLTGSISPSIANLDSLIQINLGGNKLTGSIPRNLTALKSLRSLDVSGNNLSPPLPEFRESVKLVVQGNPLLAAAPGNQTEQSPPSSSTATTPQSPPSTTPSSPPPSSTPSPPSTSSPPPPSSSSTPSPPPPSSSSTPSPPPPTSSGTTRSPPPPPPSNSGGSSGVSTGLVVGVAIGGVVVLLVLTLLCLCCKKKRRRRDDEAAYYVPPPPPPPKDDPYNGRQQHHWQQTAPPPPNHIVAGVPKPNPPPPVASRPPFPPERTPPTPPPPFISSSGGSGSNYSGSETPLPPPSPGISLGFSKSTFSYEELAMATDGFSNANLLGQGGFGYVHRGVLPNGKEVAIKQLKAGSGQGEREFQAEVEIISRVHHKHLVSLVGYCITGSQRLLVYEFVPNNTLEFHLHGKGRPTMDWSTRLKIALGSAKGLAYLHEDCHPKIIHRDIKAANILLDFKFEAKVADFGLAKFSSDANTHVSTRVMGTFGYLAPEYASSGKLSEKSDVFSFGVMLLELITGRRPVDTSQSFMDDSLVDWARPLLARALEDGNYDSLADPKLINDYDHNEMARMVACAAACVRHSAKRRPRMSQVVRALEGDVSLSDLNEGIKPGHSRVYGSYGSSDYDTMQYNEDMKKFRKMALGTQEYGASSEYSAKTTSEYGLNPSGSSSEGQTTREMEMGKVKNSRGFSGSS